jgi:diacylglycerol kinase family enzyme
MSRVAVLLNCGSRSKRAAHERARLREILQSSPLEADLLCAEGGAELAEIAQKAASSDHYEILVAAGGDGTVNAVASALARASDNNGSNTNTKTLGVLPLGTINHFAKTLGLPMDLAQAVQCLEEPETSLLDVGDVNGRLFVNNSTLGVYPRIIRFREHLRLNRHLHKWTAFAYAAARMVPGHEPQKLRLTIDGARPISASTPFVFIGRSDGKLGALDLIRGEKPGDGQLSVVLVHARRGLSLLQLASRALRGKLSEADGVEIFRAADILIEGEQRRLHVAMDGEVVKLRTPLHYRVRRRAIRVAGPKRAPEVAPAPEQLVLQGGG